jgi:hypothetical protein
MEGEVASAGVETKQKCGAGGDGRGLYVCVRKAEGLFEEV